jgi:large subunit ribosomal protein L3
VLKIWKLPKTENRKPKTENKMPGGIIGKKLGMTRIFDPEGLSVAVTVIEAGPCFISQVKSAAQDGYEALQLGFERRSLGKVNKPLKGHFEKHGSKSAFRYLREFRLEAPGEYEAGQEISLEQFAIGDRVNVIGTSKGKGFAGTIKRWNFHRGPMGHGSMSHRAPGARQSAGPLRFSAPAQIFNASAAGIFGRPSASPTAA